VHVSGRTNSRRFLDERGQTVVLFALFLPILLALGSVVMSVGNWYVHKRHLQTQVDSSVLAAAPKFSGCFQDPTGSNTAIINTAIPYSGDTARATAIGSGFVTNRQVQTQNNSHVLYNSTRYWQASDGTDPTAGGTDATMSYGGLDNSLGAPCASSFLDGKETDNRAPNLFPWLQFFPSPKTHARVEIRRVRGEAGYLPLAVPEIDPSYVYAIFVDYAQDGTQVPIKVQNMTKDQTSARCPVGVGLQFPYSCWATTVGQEAVQIHKNNSYSDGTGVIVLVAKTDTPPSMSGSVNSICAQTLVVCYDGTGAGSGLNFIHSFQGSNGSPGTPILKDVNVGAASCPPGASPGDLSSPYFTNDDNDCTAPVTAQVDFGVTGDPTRAPNQNPAGICAQVSGLTWVSTSGTISTWQGTMSIPSAAGHVALNLSWKDKQSGNGCGSLTSGGFQSGSPATVPYSADDASGPVEYVRLSASTNVDAQPDVSCTPGSGVTDPNSVPRGNYCYTVSVGLDQPLAAKPYDSPDIVLRFASKAARKGGSGTANLNGSLLCDHGATLTQTMVTGCQTFYGLNYDKWGVTTGPPPTSCATGVYCWKDVSCSEYAPSDLPPANYVNNPLPICVSAKNGQVQAFQAGVYKRWEDPGNGHGGCTPNYWPKPGSTPAQVDNFFTNHDFTNDPRYVTLIVTDNTAFSSPNTAEPVKYYAGFYVTGWDTDNGANKPKGCYNEPGGVPGACGAPNNDAHPILGCLAGKITSLDNGDLWGHFVRLVIFSSKGVPSQDLCDLTSSSPQTCVAVLSQ
jgi:hypothetical protein